MNDDPGGSALDHIVCLVPDLDAAERRARGHGFIVSPGGTHAGGLTRNALIGFEDGSYLELLAFTVPGVPLAARLLRAVGLLTAVLRRRTPLDRRFVPRALLGAGVIDFAVSVGREPAEPMAVPVPGEGPVRGRRVRPDAVALEWEMLFPSEPALPFFLRDLTDRRLRVPAGDSSRHDNGVLGVARVSVGADDPSAATRTLALAVGVDPRGDAVALGGAEIRFVERADGPAYRVWLRAAGGSELPLPGFTT